METAKALPPHIQLCASEQIHFTPVKTSNAPRVWDRKPSTSFLARSKPRKVWKRFRSSFNSMKALQQLIAPDGSGLKESELLLEINTRRTTEYSRGVKRQCLGKQVYENEDSESISGRGRSFLETKWESEVSRKRRKIPLTDILDEHMIVDDSQNEEDDEMAEFGDGPGGTTSSAYTTMQDPGQTGESPTLTPGLSDIEAAYPELLHGEAARLPNEPRGVIVDIKRLHDVSQEEVRCLTTQTAADGGAATEDVLAVAAVVDDELRSDLDITSTSVKDLETMIVPAEPVEITAEQESTLVRSALRSSLDGDDTALLNDFLSKAKAKREAKAAAEAEAATVIASDPDATEEQEQEPEPEEPPKQEVFVEIPTPERRVLEALDANTSSPQRSPSKSEKEEDASGSPVARRSTRVRGLQRAAAPTGFRTTLSLRRARGNEFVFLQRTEAQELALQTRRNTKQNKGDATLPKFTLQSLVGQALDLSPVTDENSRWRNRPKKNVSWNEARLVEFEGESSEDELAQPVTTTAKPTAPAKAAEKKRSASSRASQSTASLKTGGPDGKATAAATEAAAATTASPAPRARRVRRLGPPKPLEPTTIDSNDGASSSSPSSPTMASPVANRKKLTPKSPKRSIARPSKVPTPVVKDTEIPSLLSSGRSVKTNLLKINAGSTPMPRRVRRV